MRKQKVAKSVVVPVKLSREMAIIIRAHGIANFRNDKQTIAWALSQVFSVKGSTSEEEEEEEESEEPPIAQNNVGFFIGMQDHYFQEETCKPTK